ncbi:glutamate racemase [Zunongwangia sp. F260]|uniref:Glutamate racemase n=1 Tax=Autumnicola lenta TaxID=3075593 RepID=A0ABU3CNR8_9FLAO|nr:glutamate racemase [Zunongwangia sp. F260]MDT0647892.1 glutamate racemase [Zunongwangia sp. F260]
MSSKPIGIFDSGVGGTSIWKEIHSLMPFEKTIYLADSRNAPYGEKSVKDIVELSKKNTDKLLSMGCKIIVVACNTATTNAINELRYLYSIPFIGIEPAIKPAALKSQTKAIGILATKGTLSSALFSKTSELHTQNIKVIEVEGNGLVELIESGKKDSPEMESLLKQLLQPMLLQKIDYLVLGCSHYPYLIPTLKKILPEDVQIIDSGEAVARQTKSVLTQHDLLNTSTSFARPEFLSNKNPVILADLINAEENGFSVSYFDF